MKEELEKKLVESLDYIGTLVKSGVDITKDQYPALVKELITYKTISNKISLGLSVLFLMAGLASVYHGYTMPELEKYSGSTEMQGSAVLYCIFGMIVSGISLLASICSLQELIKLKTAPKVFIMEYLSNLVSQNNED